MNLPNTKILRHQTPQPQTNADLSRVCENPSTLKHKAFFVYLFLRFGVDYEMLKLFSSKRCKLSIGSH